MCFHASCCNQMSKYISHYGHYCETVSNDVLWTLLSCWMHIDACTKRHIIIITASEHALIPAALNEP